MSIDTAIENLMIESYNDLIRDFVAADDASMEAEQYTDQCVSDLQDDISELIVRIEALEEFKALEDKAREDKALDLLDTVARAEIDSVTAKALEEQEPRAVNQIDWILGERAGSISIFAGYPTIDMLEKFVRSNLGTEEESKTMMIIMMTLATARNLINEKLEAES
jgi:hypothetical protein